LDSLQQDVLQYVQSDLESIRIQNTLLTPWSDFVLILKRKSSPLSSKAWLKALAFLLSKTTLPSLLGTHLDDRREELTFLERITGLRVRIQLKEDTLIRHHTAHDPGLLAFVEERYPNLQKMMIMMKVYLQTLSWGRSELPLNHQETLVNVLLHRLIRLCPDLPRLNSLTLEEGMKMLMGSWLFPKIANLLEQITANPVHPLALSVEADQSRVLTWLNQHQGQRGDAWFHLPEKWIAWRNYRRSLMLLDGRMVIE
jgi:hypothetical protein